MSKCGLCGACCRNLILEVTGTDLLREPRLAKYAERYNDYDYRNWRANPDDVVFLLPSPCPFLSVRGSNLCIIYPTRPAMCVRFRAGKDERCAIKRWPQR